MIKNALKTARRVIFGVCFCSPLLGWADEVVVLPAVSRMDQIVQFDVDAHRFMGAVLVAKDNRIIFDRGFGYANLEWAIPNSPQTKFRLGSITKQFTAAAILSLEEQGKLNTSDLVKKYIPDAPAAWDKITIYHLLTHTSGIPNYTGFADYDATEPLRTSPEQLVARFKDRPLKFEPGESWRYSNSGYALLGYLIEKVSGMSYNDFLRERFFDPIGMTETGYDSYSAILPHRAAGYVWEANGPQNAPYLDMSVPYSAGALYSTTHDLMRWEQALFGGKVLSAAALKKMTTPFKENYGCGLNIRILNGRREIDHAGGINGFDTEMAFYPDDDLIVIALSNLETGDSAKVASRLAAVALGRDVVLPTDQSVSGFAQQPIYLRGSMNGWALDAKFEQIGPTSFRVVASLPTGVAEFKVGSADWVAVDLGAESKHQTYEPGTSKILSYDGQNIQMDVAQAGAFTFKLDVKDPKAPNLTVTVAEDRH